MNRSLILTSFIALTSLAVVGCQNNKKNADGSPTTTTAGVLEPASPVSGGASAPVAYTPAPQPYTPAPAPVQPVTYDTTPAPAYATNGAASSTSGATAPGGKYVVKKGDTLYSIAKAQYGNGNQYTKIVSANPGLSAGKLRVGQTITLP